MAGKKQKQLRLPPLRYGMTPSRDFSPASLVRSFTVSLQPGGLLGEVGDDEFGVDSADAQERLEHSTVAVEPAALEGGVEHEVLAGDPVDADRGVDALAHTLATGSRLCQTLCYPR